MEINVFWFRRDLRLKDNAALYHALKSGKKVLPIFIFDTNILSKLEDKSDARVEFIHQELLKINQEIKQLGSGVKIIFGNPKEVWIKLCNEYKIDSVYANQDYEPYANERDNSIKNILSKQNIQLILYKDQCIFDYTEVLKDDGLPYTVFTPYSKKWKAKLNDFYLKPFPSETLLHELESFENETIITLGEIGFHKTKTIFPEKSTQTSTIKNYEKLRDFPAVNGTSKLSLHFRFGTISIREKAKKALETSEKWLNELIWREFYMQILAHFPHVTSGAFKKDYDRIEWETHTENFQSWCIGKTGYPIVDAGMRELNETGFMHNRVRMIVASFLCKHLLISWQWGEAYFAKKLLDFDLASNNGGWQWAAGSGVDAAPYFRIFNPYLQTTKFDPNLEYIKKWVPEFESKNYPKPIVDHTFARNRCLERYKAVLSK